MRAGTLRHRVRVYEMTQQVATSGANPLELSPSPVFAAVQPLAPGASTDDRAISHAVTIRYHPLVTLDCYLLFGTRKLFVRGIQNVDEMNAEQRLLCEEVV